MTLPLVAHPVPHVVAAAPPLIVHRGNMIVRSRRDGRIVAGDRDGFLVADTRLLSSLEWRVRAVTPRRWRVRQTSTDRVTLRCGDETGITLTLVRALDAGGWLEIVSVTAGARPVATVIDLLVSSDVADVFEVRGLAPSRQRSPTISWNQDQSVLRFAYANGEFRRGLAVRVLGAASPPRRIRQGLRFEVTLSPAASWTVRVRFEPSGNEPGASADRTSSAPQRGVVASPEPTFARPWKRALLDLESLVLADSDPMRGFPIPVAGIPWYAAVFGRDALICGIQMATTRPEVLHAALVRLALLQASEDDADRDMEPGKILHEVREGELARLGLIPFSPYFGSHDATSLFLIALSEWWRTTHDDGLVRTLWPNARRALDWIDRYGDRDSDGFQEYCTRAKGGFRHQGWRDSVDAIVHGDGRDAHPPIALAEHQGYAHDAKVRVAELAEQVIGDEAMARRLREEARRLKDRFNETFWWADEGTYAIGLDSTGTPIRSVTSAPGHCLWSGIVEPDRAAQVVERLMAPDIFSGWGLRTLASSHPAYDPFAYHRGSVWPHDTAIAVAGLRRYGFSTEADRLARAMLQAAAGFPLARLPEVFAGIDRTVNSRPVSLASTSVAQVASWRSSRDGPHGAAANLLTEANGPQAWAASAVISLVRGMAGTATPGTASAPVAGPPITGG